MRKILIDVRTFAIPVPLVGHIETHSGYGRLPMNGQDLHQMIQRRRLRDNESYSIEKSLARTFVAEDYEFVISGRVDGFADDPPLIEEIKSCFDTEDLRAKLLTQEQHPYLWQLRTYGYFYFKETGIIPKLQFVLISSRTFRTSEIEISLDVDKYETWLNLRLLRLVEETRYKEKLFKRRTQTATSMAFPFAHPRPGQNELIQNVTSHFANGHPLLAQAPTGLGKTVGILYPSLLDALKRGQKVIYLTPKNSQHSVAEEAVQRLQDQGSKIRSLTITAKSKMCLKAEPLCNPSYCEYAKDYYKKLDEHKILEKLRKFRRITRHKLIDLGQEYQVCPFELSVEAIEKADVVIGDYNYVFSPRSLIGKLSESLLDLTQKPNLIIDEAHNLVARSQDYFSPSLSVVQLYAIERQLPKLPAFYSIRAQSALVRAKELLQSYGDEGKSKLIEIEIEPFEELDQDIRKIAIEYLESGSDVLPQDPLLKLMNLWSDFVNALTHKGEEFFQTYQNNAYGEMIKVTCCDASEHLQMAYKEFKNVVAFSATLKPFSYYQELLGFVNEKTRTVEFQSPFTSDNRKLLIIPQISTKYADRTSHSRRIAETIARIAQVKTGNYLALFPSFEFMRMVLKVIHLPGYRILEQEREMKQAQTEAIIESLKQPTPTVLFCVQGGVFSEGVDFPGDMVIGAFVVGPALPNFDFERDQIRKYYEGRYGKEQGFNYAYVYPAMAKAIQSAGRVIRSEKDRGIIILMDSRFLNKDYYSSMPEGWFNESPHELVSQKILTDLQVFWDRG